MIWKSVKLTLLCRPALFVDWSVHLNDWIKPSLFASQFANSPANIRAAVVRSRNISVTMKAVFSLHANLRVSAALQGTLCAKIRLCGQQWFGIFLRSSFRGYLSCWAAILLRDAYLLKVPGSLENARSSVQNYALRSQTASFRQHFLFSEQ